jgi:phosphoribosylformylglycinamidine (FGAM) synthase PurS component
MPDDGCDPVFCEIAIRRLERYRERGAPDGRTVIRLNVKLRLILNSSLIRRGGANARQGIRDAQVGRPRSTGKAIQHAAGTIGYQAIEDVRQGKYFEIKLNSSLAAAEAKAQVERFCAGCPLESR